MGVLRRDPTLSLIVDYDELSGSASVLQDLGDGEAAREAELVGGSAAQVRGLHSSTLSAQRKQVLRDTLAGFSLTVK